ncbi:MAG: radical SAM protein [Candidatus Woesearchaeota archaeon]
MQAYIAELSDISEENLHGRLSLAVYFAGCDFHCVGCNTPALREFKSVYMKELREVKNHIKMRMPTAVTFTGGEPCLQKEALFDLAKFCRRLGIKTAIETNGSRPDVLRALLLMELIDFVALDIKAPLTKDIFQRVSRCNTFFKGTDSVIEDITCSIDVLKEFQAKNPKLDIEFRTTIIPGNIYRKEHILEIADKISGFYSRYRLQQYRPENVADKNMKNINSPSKEFLKNLANAIRKQYPDMRVVVS